MAEEQGSVGPTSESDEIRDVLPGASHTTSDDKMVENIEPNENIVDEENIQPESMKSPEKGDDLIHRSPPPEAPSEPGPEDDGPEPMDTSTTVEGQSAHVTGGMIEGLPLEESEEQNQSEKVPDSVGEDGEQAEKEPLTDMGESSGVCEGEMAQMGAVEESDANRIVIVIKTQDETKEVSVGPDATVAELKLAVSSSFKISVNRICLIFSGKMLLDEETLETHRIANDSTVYLMAKPLQQTTESSGRPAFNFMPSQFTTIGTAPVSFGQLQHQLQKQMADNPDLVRQLVDNPLVQQLMANPTVMKEMMMSVPQSRDLLERNPEISDLLSNQEVMRQTLDLARNPATLEAVLAQAEEANSENFDGSPEIIRQSSLGFNGFSFPGFNMGANASIPDGTTLLQQLTSNPQLVQRMLEAPYMPTVMEGLAKNPVWAQQMIAQNPLFAGNPHLQQQMAVMMPYYIQQMQNPEMLSLMTNPKALQAMLRIQQGMNVLQSEAPNLAGSIGLPYLSVPPSAASFAAMHFKPPSAGDAGREAFAQYDPFSIMMSQIVQQMANKQLNLPPEERYIEQLDRLSSMGFTDRDSNLQVLIGTFGDVTAAADQLMRQRNN